MSRVISWQLQHGFHLEQKNYLGYGEVQRKLQVHVEPKLCHSGSS